jgi:hypothetical protein
MVVSTQALMTAFPVVFMVHDFEELCFLESWIARNLDYLRSRAIGRNWVALAGRRTSALAVTIMLMFWFVSATSVLSVAFGLYALFAAAMLVFAAHNAAHILQSVVLQKYVPAAGTSAITIPYPLYVLSRMSALGLFAWRDALVISVFFGALTFASLAAAQRVGLWIDGRLNRT